MIDRSTPALGGLFKELILDHYKRPRNRGSLEDATADIHMNNPVCGDEVHLYLHLEDGVIEGVSHVSQGCSISQASVSMMTQLLKGKTIEEALRLARRFTEVMHGDEEAARDKDLGDLRALAGVSRFPARVKCALLGWNALEEAVRDDPSPERETD